jgi:serine/threonine-protein kinase
VLCPDLPPSVDAFFDRALARDPNLRFQSARELAAAFSDLLPSQVRGAHDGPYAPPPLPMGPAIAPVPRTHDGGTPAPSWPAAQGSWPGAQGSWPGTPPPIGTPHPHAGGSGSWPGQNLQRTGDRTGGTLAHGVATGSMPAAPQRTPWVLLGSLAAVAAVTLTAAGFAFMQSRGGPVAASTGEAPEAAPAPEASAAPPPPVAEPTAQEDTAPSATATASATAPKKLQPKAAAPPASTSKRDLGY